MKESKCIDLAILLKMQNEELNKINLVDLAGAIEEALEKVGVEITEKAVY